jgi:nucleotide-binding universal stress UspA family protein
MQKHSRILLLYDGSAEARLALARCAQLAMALSASVDVLSIVDSSNLNAACGGQLSGLAFEHLEQLAREAADEAIAQLRSDGIFAHGHIAVGQTVDTLSRHANVLSPDIVIVGHTGRRRLARWWHGSPLYADITERLRGLTVVVAVTPV